MAPPNTLKTFILSSYCLLLVSKCLEVLSSLKKWFRYMMMMMTCITYRPGGSRRR